MARRARLFDLDPRTVAWILIACGAVVIAAFHPALRRRPTLRPMPRTPQPAPSAIEVLTERAAAPAIPAAPAGREADPLEPADETGDAAALADPAASFRLELELARWPDLAPVAARSARVVGPGWSAGGITDEAGRVNLVLPAGEDRSELEVCVPGFAPRSLFLPADSDGAVKSVPLRPARGYSGVVLDAEGQPASGVDVIGWYVEVPRPRFGTPPTRDAATHLRLLPQRAWSGRATRTTWKGTYYLPEPDADVVGELCVAALSPGLSTTIVRVPFPRADTELPPLRLQAPRVVTGSVVDAQSRPLAGASVRATLETGACVEFPVGITDDEGRFEVVVPRGEVLLHADKVGYAMRPGRLYRTTVRLPREDAGPLARPPGDALVAGWSDERPYVRATGDEVAPIVLDRLPVREVFVFETGVAATDARHELAGVEVRVRFPDELGTELVTETGRDGVATVPLASRGLQPVRISLTLNGYDYVRPLDRRLGYSTWYQERGEDRYPVRLVRVPEADPPPEEVRVRGFVTGLLPDERATVRVYSAGQGAPGVLSSIEIGRLETNLRGSFDGQVPWSVLGGAVRVVATAGDGVTSRFASSGLVELDELDDFELRLRLEPTARVALRPVFPEEHDEWTVVVRASSAPGFSDLWSRTLTVRRGDERPLEFHLPIGASLVAQAVPHGEEVAARVSAPEEVLDLPLPPLVSLSGSATGIDPLQDRIGLEDADGRHAAYARLGADGAFRFDGCPPGVYELFLYRRLDGETPLEHRAEVEVLATARVTANESRADLVLQVDP